jgi:DsbC/DsbD-like thiol-disulfide interchange protein/cytochrome c biogenesis protein CcdA
VVQFSLLLSLSWATEAQALSDRAATPQVEAQLVASASSIEPGAGFYVGLHQKIIPNWHTYWTNPGDSGSATTIKWTLPEGATASGIIWPTPSRYSLGPITNYAYAGEVTLLTRINVPGDTTPGESFALRALVDWLVCEEECIPQQVELELSLPVVAAGESVTVNDPRIEDALARLPVPSPWDIRAVQSAPDPNTRQGQLNLNLMPCVFPVLSLKALSLVSHSSQSAVQVRLHGLHYTLGVLASFAGLATLLVLLKAGGAQIGWGFQFQSPLFVLAMAYLMFAVGLNLSGVFFVGGSIAGVGSSLTEKPGYSGSFFTGVLATVVATPCTAPFMAAALGYALAQPAAKLLAIFLSLGLGLALPYLLLTCWPRAQRWLPRPGVWMERAKQLLAFPMYATAIWLVWVLVQQAGANSMAVALGGMLLIAFAAWLYDTTLSSGAPLRWAGTAAACLVLLLVLGMSYISISSSSINADSALATGPAAEQNWEPFSETRLDELLDEGKPVFLNFTASWCISCLVNEQVALSDVKVKETFRQQGIVYLKGDWTNRDLAITQFLQKYNRSGVPFYLFYPAGKPNQPAELPQILTPDMVIAAVTAQAPD